MIIFFIWKKFLRNEGKWEADELLADIMGTSAEDNAEDLSRYEDRNSFLINLSTDFSAADTADLKNEFTLKGFDTAEGLLEKFFSSLEEGEEEEASFYFELVKIQYMGELYTVNKGRELLCLDESSKSSGELISEIAEDLAGKRKDLLGEEYENEDILLFFEGGVFADLALDTEDPDLIEKIKEIALLEAEIRAIEKYSPYSAAFMLHERCALYEKLSSLFFLADDGDVSSIGITSSFETRDDLVKFYKNLKNCNAPLYIEEITGKVLEGVIKDRGFVFDDDLSDLEKQITSFNSRIENYTLSDPLSPVELEKIRDELSLQLETLEDLNSIYSLSCENKYSDIEKRVYEDLVVKALKAVKEGSDIITSADTVKEKKSLIGLRAAEYQERNKNLDELGKRLEDWETEQAEYFISNIADKKSSLEKTGENLSSLREEYHDLLNNFTSLTDQYRLKKKTSDNLLIEFNESKWLLYEAEELKQFADSPYPLRRQIRRLYLRQEELNLKKRIISTMKC